MTAVEDFLVPRVERPTLAGVLSAAERRLDRGCTCSCAGDPFAVHDGDCWQVSPPSPVARVAAADGDVRTLLVGLRRMLAVHTPVRVFYVGDAEGAVMYNDPHDAAEAHGVDLRDVESIEVCLSCAQLEASPLVEATAYPYVTSIYPCPTVALVEGAVRVSGVAR